MLPKYYIYRNLRTGGFSIKHTGIVVERNNWFAAYGIKFSVSKPGLQRVIKDGQKNVHAYVVADSYSSTNVEVDKLYEISYNPYVAEYFVCNKQVINNAQQVLFKNGKCYLLK